MSSSESAVVHACPRLDRCHPSSKLPAGWGLGLLPLCVAPLSPHPDTSLWEPRSPRTPPTPGTRRPRSRADQLGPGAALLLDAVCSPPGRPWVPSLFSMGMSVLVSHGSLGSNAAWLPGSQPASIGLWQSSLLASATAGLGSLQADCALSTDIGAPPAQPSSAVSLCLMGGWFCHGSSWEGRGK